MGVKPVGGEPHKPPRPPAKKKVSDIEKRAGAAAKPQEKSLYAERKELGHKVEDLSKKKSKPVVIQKIIKMFNWLVGRFHKEKVPPQQPDKVLTGEVPLSEVPELEEYLSRMQESTYTEGEASLDDPTSIFKKPPKKEILEKEVAGWYEHSLADLKKQASKPLAEQLKLKEEIAQNKQKITSDERAIIDRDIEIGEVNSAIKQLDKRKDFILKAEQEKIKLLDESIKKKESAIQQVKDRKEELEKIQRGEVKKLFGRVTQKLSKAEKNELATIHTIINDRQNEKSKIVDQKAAAEKALDEDDRLKSIKKERDENERKIKMLEKEKQGKIDSQEATKAKIAQNNMRIHELEKALPKELQYEKFVRSIVYAEALRYATEEKLEVKSFGSFLLKYINTNTHLEELTAKIHKELEKEQLPIPPNTKDIIYQALILHRQE